MEQSQDKKRAGEYSYHMTRLLEGTGSTPSQQDGGLKRIPWDRAFPVTRRIGSDGTTTEIDTRTGLPVQPTPPPGPGNGSTRR